MGDCACREDWRRFFWLVSVRRGKQRNLRTDVEGRKADALVIWFVVAWGDASAVSIEGVECAGSVDEVDGLKRFAVAVADVGVEEVGNVENASVVARIAVAGVVVVHGVRAFTGDGVGAKAGGVHWVLNGRERTVLCQQSKVRVSERDGVMTEAGYVACMASATLLVSECGAGKVLERVEAVRKGSRR